MYSSFEAVGGFNAEGHYSNQLMYFVGAVLGFVTMFIMLLVIVRPNVSSDARMRKMNGLFWSLISVFFFPFGLFIYLLASSRKPNLTPLKSFLRKNISTTVFIGLLYIASLVGLYFGTMQFVEHPTMPFETGMFGPSTNRYNNRQWRYTARRANGQIGRTLNLTQDELNQFYVDVSYNGVDSDGVFVTLILAQDGYITRIPLPSDFSGFIDTSEFSAGIIEVQFQLTRIENVNITVRWR